MVTELRRSADAEAQRAWHALCVHRGKHPDQPDRLLEGVVSATERVVDAVSDLEYALYQLAQRDDPEAPDFFGGWQENELRAAWGNR